MNAHSQFMLLAGHLPDQKDRGPFLKNLAGWPGPPYELASHVAFSLYSITDVCMYIYIYIWLFLFCLLVRKTVKTDTTDRFPGSGLFIIKREVLS